MSVANPVVQTWDGANRRIYLKQGITTWNWVDDLYKEYRNERKITEAFRVWNPLLLAKGNEPKGGGKYTPRYVILLEGVRIVPFDENILQTVTGEGITDDASDPFDTSTRVQPLKLYITPPAAEIIRDEVSLQAINRMSFNNGITIDVVNGVDDPLNGLYGNEEYPCNTLAKAIAIANTNGFTNLYILESMILDAGTDLTNFHITGRSHVLTELSIDTSLICPGLTIENCHVTGVLDDGTHIVGCMVGDITYVNGHLHNSELHGTITLAGNQDAVFMNCGVSDSTNLPIVDIGISGQNCIFNDWSGGITFNNMNDITGKISMQIDGGKVILDSTMTEGTLEMTGVGLLENNSGSNFIVHSDGLMNRELITKTSWDKVHINSTCVNCSSGTIFPTGTLDNPVDNLADAITIAINNNIRNFELGDNLTLTQDVSNYIFTGFKSNMINLNGQTCVNSQFNQLILTGNQADPIKAENCMLTNLQGLNGAYNGCVMVDTTPMLAAIDSNIFMNNCRSGVPGNDSPIIDFTNGNIGFNNRAYSGGIRIQNSTDAFNITTVEFIAGKFNFGVDNTAGYFAVRGVVDRSGINSGGATVALTGANLQSGEVWDEAIADHQIVGSFGHWVKKKLLTLANFIGLK
ncbi:MAG: hypothetical protein PF693_21545 [Spirochaetia bacterium]|jgi:hypothetical protein|nr:hypothetical protein [Spirochaetia bacterium]